MLTENWPRIGPEDQQPPPRRAGSILRTSCKRLVDVLGASIMLVLLTPACALIAAAVALDGGPILYAHTRVGRQGRSFRCYKFRSMVPQADRVLADLLQDPQMRAAWETKRKLPRDARVTRIGRILRVTSLDELPQLFNVLRGDMSLVGPRPVVREELERHYARLGAQAAYLSVRPGITGLWQVSGRSDTSYDSRVLLDLAYVEEQSILTDLAILLRTPAAVLRGRGAC
ncbi:sugar transferase [Paracraurococcus ruber]|uniref:Bacterial sugar transferase domain-containing protein n=1 Tax=Paracraurococcus ruber TaxID=77675 RepID=A0ABS1CUC4_9PROT|nr:sugar transferase [Paracraurococcus ruber]MBK1658095.1 hypothetical protein [Paracraurococcus ruber]TDG32375.1 sugar transferase [Paracraurococcus ruber]